MAPSRLAEKGSKIRKSTQSSVASSRKPTRPVLSSQTITLSEDSTTEESDDSDTPQAKVISVSTDKAAKKRKIDVVREERLPKVNGAVKTNGKKRAQDSDDSESSKESSSDDSDAPRPNGKASSNSAMILASESNSDSSSNSESEEEEESDDGMILDTPPKPRSEAIQASHKSRAVESNAIDDWSPPTGFERITIKSTSSDLLSTLASSSTLQGKQIWHITVPEDVDISSIHTLDPSVIDSGAAAFTSPDNSAYTFRTARKRDIEGSLVLIPDGKSNAYTSVKAHTTKSLELQQVMPGAGANPRHDEKDPEEWSLDPAKLVAQRTYEKVPPPKQREGLRVMNVPIGVVAAKEPATFEQPRSAARKPVEADELRDEEGRKETTEERAARKAEKARRKELKAQKKAAKAGK